jgi:oligopeptide transport system substrate-binding protein
MKNLRRGLLPAILVFAMAMAMACGGGSDSGSGGGGGDALSPNSGGSSGGSTASGDLRFVGSDPLTMDPHQAQDAGSAAFIVEIFGGLVTLDQNLKVVPDIAESWDTSADGKTYTFHIRKGALFHDGRQVTADDVKYSLERAAKLGQTTSTTADAYLGDIVGVKDVIRGKADSISGVKVVDASTVQITIDAPKAYFLAKMTYPTAFVVDKAQIDKDPKNWTRKPNGTGPFKLTEWRLNERMILTANDKYHLGAPFVKRVLFNLAGGSTLTQYENNEIDESFISINDIERVQSSRDPLSKEYVKAPQLSVSYIGFNTTVAPFDDPKVRQAFAASVDKDQITKVIFKDMAVPAQTIMMPGLPGYAKENSAPKFDPAAAKQLIADSKYKSASGLGKITLTEVGSGASAGLDTQAMVEGWKKNLGVDVTIAESETATFYDDLDQGKMQMWTNGWIMDYPDPEDILDLLFTSTSRQNNSKYNNPQFDALMNQARTETDVTKRLQMYKDGEKILLNDVPWVPLYFGVSHYVVKPYVKNYNPGAIVIPYLRYIKIEK